MFESSCERVVGFYARVLYHSGKEVWILQKTLHKFVLTLIICQLLLGGALVAGDDQSQSVSRTPDALIRKTDSGDFMIGNVVIKREQREIEIPGRVNMDAGMLEYLAVTDYGKTHEAIAIIDAQPMQIQLALLLLGADYGGNLRFQGDTLVPQGDKVSIRFKWQTAAGDTMTVPAGNLLREVATGRIMEEPKWVFTGSFIFEEKLMADLEGSIVACFSDPVAIVNNSLRTRIDDTIYEVNSAVVPKVGTKLIMTITVPKKD